jgi:hypothetical protein
MMIDSSQLDVAKKLKKKMDAAYKVLKKAPTADSVTTYTLAVRAYNDFCTKTITDLLDAEAVDKTAEVLANLEKYKTCKHCDEDLIFLTTDTNYIASSEFLEDFPGWCFTCLLEHCLAHDCEGCTVSTRPSNCSFLEIKKLHQQD